MRLINTDNLDVVGFESNDMSDEYKKGFCDGLLKMGEVIDNTPTINPETLPEVIALKKQLAEVTAEKNAAVDALENVAMYEDSLCKYCAISDKCGLDQYEPCMRFEWRGEKK